MGKKIKKKHAKPLQQSPSNPLLEQQVEFLRSLNDDERDSYFSVKNLDPDRRAQIWMDQADLGSNLVEKYSWATPDERAIRILKQFSPIVEVGCGANAYWCRMMRAAGIDVLGYDSKPKEGGKLDRNKNEKSVQSHDFPIKVGGPDVLANDNLKNHTLFLCYPDEEALETDDSLDDEDDEQESRLQSLGSACLEHFQGKYVIHVGELYGDTLSMDHAPWGRSSGPDFQQRLASEYHCLLRANLTNWLHVRDTISVWKRSELCPIVFDAEDDDDEEEEVEYRHIPQDEMLPVDLAAPCLAYLLDVTVDKTSCTTMTIDLKDRDESDSQQKTLQKGSQSDIVQRKKSDGEDITSSNVALGQKMLEVSKGDDTSTIHEVPSTTPAIRSDTSNASMTESPQVKAKKKRKRKRGDSSAPAQIVPSFPKVHHCPW